LHGKKAAGRVALISDEDYQLVMQYRWYIWENPRPGLRTNGPYAIATVRLDGKKTTVLMHRVIRPDLARVDHQNHDGLDNQRFNLRDGSGPRNDFNRRKQSKSTSKYIGVYWHARSSSWCASIHVGPKTKYLGSFDTEEAAARARDDAAVEARGSAAKLNFVRR